MRKVSAQLSIRCPRVSPLFLRKLQVDLVGTLEQAAGDAVREEEQEPNIALKSQTYHPSYPIDNYEGDLVLLSKDGVLFRVHSLILKIASSLFREMLEIPRSSSESAGDPIPVEENAAIVAIMLDAIYPNTILREVATRRNVELYAEELTAAADKYDVPAISATVKRALFTGTGKVPSLNDRWSAIRLYDLAHKHGWAEEKRIASRWTLHYCLTSPEALSELRRVSAHTILQLQDLRRQRIHLYKASLKSIAGGTEASRIVYKKRKVNHPDSCTFETSDAWKFFMYEIQEELTTNPLGSRLLKNDTWDNSLGCAQIFEMLHFSDALSTLRLPSKRRFITKAQNALQTLPTFI